MNKQRFLENLKNFYKGYWQGMLIFVPLTIILSLILAAFDARE